MKNLFFSSTKEVLVDKSFKKVRFRNFSMGDFMFMFNIHPPLPPPKKKRRKYNLLKIIFKIWPLFIIKNCDLPINKLINVIHQGMTLFGYNRGQFFPLKFATCFGSLLRCVYSFSDDLTYLNSFFYLPWTLFPGISLSYAYLCLTYGNNTCTIFYVV